MSNDLIDRIADWSIDQADEVQAALEAKDQEIEQVREGAAQLMRFYEKRIAELEAKGLAVLDSWENGNYDGDLDGNMLELAEALGERDDNC